MTPARDHLLAALANAATVALLQRSDLPACQAAELRVREALHAWDAEAYATPPVADMSPPVTDLTALVLALTRLVLASGPGRWLDCQERDAGMARLRKDVIAARATLAATITTPLEHGRTGDAPPQCEAEKRAMDAQLGVLGMDTMRPMVHEPWEATQRRAMDALSAHIVRVAAQSAPDGAEAEPASCVGGGAQEAPGARQDAAASGWVPEGDGWHYWLDAWPVMDGREIEISRRDWSETARVTEISQYANLTGLWWREVPRPVVDSAGQDDGWTAWEADPPMHTAVELKRERGGRLWWREARAVRRRPAAGR